VIIASRTNTTHFRYIDQLQKTFKLFGCKSGLGFFNKEDYIGANVEGKDVLVYNNLVRTGNLMTQQIKSLKELGARDIYYFGFHGMCIHDDFENLVSSLPLEELIMTNTVFQAH
jgi:phosphoribosylpyrophosphate synthetase